MKRGYRLLYMIAGVMILLSAVFFEKNIGLASFMEDDSNIYPQGEYLILDT